MPPVNGRVWLRVRLTPDARDGLELLAARNKVTLTALLQAMGEESAKREGQIGELTSFGTAVFERAAAIDLERRSRRR